MKTKAFTLILIIAAFFCGLAWISRAVPVNAPLVYKAKLTQDGSSDPASDVFENTTGRDISWQRIGQGYYIGIPSSQFASGSKFFATQPVRDNSADVTTGSGVVFTEDGNEAAIYFYSYGTPEDGSLQHIDVNGAVFISFEMIEP